MATSPIDSGDLSLLRSNGHAIRDIALFTTPLTTVATLTVTAIPTTYPTVSLTFSGSATGVTVGQLIKISDGTTIKAYAVVRKAVSGSTLFISETQLGAYGYATRIENAIEVNDTITVYNHHAIWNLNSRIANKVFYKYWDRAYTDENEDIPPVSNTGEWQAAKLASGETVARFRLPRVGSNTSFAIGTTLSSRLWAIPSGVTLVTGYALTDSVIEVDAIAGSHLVSQTVTDANGKTHIAYCWLFVSDGSTGASLDERYSVQITSDTQDRKGRKLQCTITGDSSLADVLYAGAGVLLRVWYDYEGQELTEGVAVDSFIGYIAETLDISHDGDTYTASFTVQSPFLVASRIAQPPQSLTEKTSPTKWTECTSSLSNPQGYLYYAIKWHCPTLLDMHDFDAGSYTTPRRRFCQYNTNNLAAAMEVPAQFIRGNVGSASNGTTVMRKNPNLMNNSDRNALDVLLTFQTQDLRRKFDYSKRWGQEFAEGLTGAFATNGTTDKAYKSIKKWGQGIGRTELPDSVVTIAEGQAKCNEIVGHFLAEMNADIQELTLFLNGFIDVIDPVYLDNWIRFTVSSDFDPLGVGFDNERSTATKVTRQWEITKDDIYVTVDVGLKPETFGQPGELYPIGSASTSSGVVTPVDYLPAIDSAFSGNGMALIIDDNGNMAVTYNILDANPNWQDLTANFTGLVNDIDFDFNSAFFSSGNITTQALGIYVATTDSTDFHIWRIPNILDAGSIPTLLHTETMNDASVTTEGRIICSETTPTLVLGLFKDNTGTEFTRSTDGGGTFSAKANIGSAIVDVVGNINAPLGADIRGALQVVSAPDGSGDFGLYKATTASGAFSEVTNTERNAMPNPLVKISGATSAYASTKDIDTSGSETVTFDVGGYSSYTIVDVINSSATVQAGGNPNDCVRESGTAANQDVVYYVSVDLGATVNVTAFDFDVYQHTHTSSFGGIYVSTDIYVQFYLSGVEQYYIRFTGGASAPERDTWLNFSVDILANTSHLISSWVVGVGLRDAGGTPFSFPDGLPCDEIRVQIGNTNDTDDWDYRLDNLASDFVTGGARTLYRITTLTGSSTWTDISPDTEKAPIRPNDLTIDRVDNAVVRTVAFDGANFDLYTSDDSGTTWDFTENGTTKRTCVSQADGLLFAGASGEVLLSLNNGSTYTDITSNLAAIWADVGTIKKALIL